jgi:hypothetical protein
VRRVAEEGLSWLPRFDIVDFNADRECLPLAAALGPKARLCECAGQSVDRDTYRLFDLQTGVPTDAYSAEAP